MTAMKPFQALDTSEMERLFAAIESSLEIRKRFQFYLWAQGALQGCIPHETLLCAHGDIARMRMRHESFSSGLFEAQIEREVGDPANGLLARMVDGWLRRGGLPQVGGVQTASLEGLAAPARSRGYDVGDVLGHGPREVRGEFGSFFLFVRMPRPAGQRETYLLELLMPYMHMALYRMLSGEGAVENERPPGKSLLSLREIEVLQWIKQGKTNDEIGQILGICAPTVKNHVQKILRKLKVSNRAQAVGRSESLRLLPPGEFDS
jgi:transcriptional regulator EpsA